MTRQEMAYLFLERLAMEGDHDSDSFSTDIRDHLDFFWEALSQEERTRLNTRPGRTMDAINPTKISVDDAGLISVVFRSGT